jgi:hypothetical protein
MVCRHLGVVGWQTLFWFTRLSGVGWVPTFQMTFG